MPVPIVRRNEELKFGGADKSSRDAPYINLRIVEPDGVYSATLYADNFFWKAFKKMMSYIRKGVNKPLMQLLLNCQDQYKES